ncbi:hypothetical protein DTO169E5_3527 [Paecilomyces variotii]|nr:hypothetical protein DTO169E5_3527 [Paecilomyces variotii]
MAQTGELKPTKTAALNLPSGSNTCELSILNTTCDMTLPTISLIGPNIKGHENLNLPTFSFYIYNARQNKRVLFDLGSRKDWWNFTPVVLDAVKTKGISGLRITHDVADVLAEGGIDPKTIDAVVWSHFHWDHVGNIQLFPKNVDVVVGAPFKSVFLPGYPTGPNSPFYEADFEGRNIVELEFDGSLKIGQFLAHDYFGDGSFYLLKVPGHTAGHISGLVRTTPDTFVFLGGDVCHFPGAYRPSEYIPMPETLPAETKLDARIPLPCPCSYFTACHPHPERARTTPFYRVSEDPGSWYEDAPEAQRSVDKLTEFDGDENVFLAIAHDPALQDTLTFFPNGTINDWKAKGWKRTTHWGFVNELPVDGKPGRPALVEGLLKGDLPIQ